MSLISKFGRLSTTCQPSAVAWRFVNHPLLGLQNNHEQKNAGVQSQQVRWMGRWGIVRMRERVRRAKKWKEHPLEPTLDKDVLNEPVSETDPRLVKDIKYADNNSCPVSYRDFMTDRLQNVLMHYSRREKVRIVLERTLEYMKREQIKLKRDPNISPEDAARIETNPRVILNQAIINATPMLRLHPVERGGIEYQTPADITPLKARRQAMNWIKEKVDPRNVEIPEKKIPEYIRLGKELLNAFRMEGRVIKAKQELHKECEANRAYASFRFITTKRKEMKQRRKGNKGRG